MSKLKQLIKVADVYSEINNSILCFKEKEKHSFLTKNNSFIKAYYGQNLNLDKNQAFDILNKNIVRLNPEAFEGRVFVISSFGGFELNYKKEELDTESDFVYLPKEKFKVSLMQKLDGDDYAYIFNVYTDSGIVMVVTDNFGVNNEGEFLITNQSNVKEIEGYVLLTEERGPISYSKKFSDDYLAIANFSDLGLKENSRKELFPTLIFVENNKVLDIQLLNVNA